MDMLPRRTVPTLVCPICGTLATSSHENSDFYFENGELETYKKVQAAIHIWFKVANGIGSHDYSAISLEQ